MKMPCFRVGCTKFAQRKASDGQYYCSQACYPPGVTNDAEDARKKAERQRNRSNKTRPKSEMKAKALGELKNALTLASLASRQMESQKESLTVKEIDQLMQKAQVPKLKEAVLPDYKGFGFYHKSGKKIRYFSLTAQRPSKGSDATKPRIRAPKRAQMESVGADTASVAGGEDSTSYGQTPVKRQSPIDQEQYDQAALRQYAQSTSPVASHGASGYDQAASFRNPGTDFR